MRTKIVYVLTSTPEARYIEKAQIAIFSARYHNPTVHIVLLVDDRTNMLFVGARAELLKYVSEKIVVNFSSNVDVIERSRWLKTNVRKLIIGDFLFLDIDTIVLKTLQSIDDYACAIGAVFDYQVPLVQYPKSIYNYVKNKLDALGMDITNEKHYFNSGVMYVKDVDVAHQLYDKWFKYWEDWLDRPFIGDQPHLCRANSEMGHIITALPGVWNCIMYTYPTFDKTAYVLHFSELENMCFLFDYSTLDIIREKGIDEFKKFIIDPHQTYIAHLSHRIFSSFSSICKTLKFIHKHCEGSLKSYLIKVPHHKYVYKFVKCKKYIFAALYICGMTLFFDIMRKRF